MFAWIHLDIITTLKFKKGIAYPDLPARVGQYPPPHAYAHGDGVYLAEDTTTFPLPPYVPVFALPDPAARFFGNFVRGSTQKERALLPLRSS